MFREIKDKITLPTLQWKEKIAVCLFLLGITISISGLLLLWNQTNTPIQANSSLETSDNSSQESPLITIDVGGAVNRPGIYNLKEGARISHAVAEAGGFSDSADPYFITHTLNLATVLNDSEKIYIPFISERKKEIDQKLSVSETNQNGISINNGSLEELDTLEGIGEKRAESIISNRPYSSLEELVTKKVLTQTMFDSLKNQLIL